MKYLEKKYASIYLILFQCFILFGMSGIVTGALLPKIFREFQWSYLDAGLVIAAGSIGYFLTTFISGILIHYFKVQKVLIIGMFLQAVALFFFAAHSFVWFNFMLNFLIGVGHGVLEVCGNYTVVRMEKKGEGHLMGLLHAAFSIGAIVGPFLVGLIVSYQLAWQLVYRIMALLSLILAIGLGFLPFNRLSQNTDEPGQQQPVFSVLKYPIVILSFFILLVYVGFEIGISNWISEYMVQSYHQKVSLGAFMVSIFWIGLFMGRVFIPFLFKGKKFSYLLLGLSVFATVTLTFVLVINQLFLAGIGVFLIGLGCSFVYPLVIIITGQNMDQVKSVAVGIASTGGGVGGFIFPFAMSFISNHFNLQIGFYFYLGLGFIMIGLSFIFIHILRPKQHLKAS